MKGLENQMIMLWAQQRGRAAAKKQGMRHRVRIMSGSVFQFPPQRLYVRRHQMIQIGIGIKGAISAARAAKGDMKVNRQGLLCKHLRPRG